MEVLENFYPSTSPVNLTALYIWLPDEIVAEKEKYKEIGDGLDLAFVELYDF